MLKWIPRVLFIISLSLLALLYVGQQLSWLYSAIPIAFAFTAIFSIIFRKNTLNQIILFISIGVLAGMLTFALLI
ncbi:hypothetical protein [Filobacillus milosensis]|nr:hypothetical protein [Filobacillus milosensis]